MTKSLSLALAALIAIGLPAVAPAQKQADPPKQEQKQEPEKTEEQKAAAKKAEEQKKKEDEYDKAVKDLDKSEGPFTFYIRKRDVLIELREGDLDKLFLIQAAFGTGSSASGTQAGDPIGDTTIDAFRWRKEEDQLWLVKPNRAYRWDPENPLGLASTRSFPEAILGSYRIEQQHPTKKLLLVNVTPLFHGDVFQLNDLVNMGVGGQYVLDREKCSAEKIKSFDENTVVRMRLHFLSPRGAQRNPLAILLGLGGSDHLADSRSLPMTVTYNLWYRKDTDYRPRLADPRVGYFTEDFYSVDRFLQKDRTERYIMRYNLRKKDPEAALSEPVKPIVWTIDPSVPAEYREACRDGILRWNAAFEKLGYKNAIVVKDAPADDPDWDHADGRHNIFRWTMSPEEGYAISLFRTDPYTGEILNASITFDANMLAFATLEHQRLATPAALAMNRAMDVLLRNPERKATDDRYLWATESERERNEAIGALDAVGWRRLQCSYGHGLQETAALGWNALLAAPGGIAITKEEYARQFIRDVVSHEMGHCLGLRHNFVGSTVYTTAELADDNLTSASGNSASVMDYVPVNVQAILKGRGNFYSPKIGPYDEWAIQYGYTDIKAFSPIGERHMLDRIASSSTKPGLAYQSDENADGWNPYVVRFDNAKDPLSYSQKMLEAAQRVRKYAIEKLPKPGEGYGPRTQMILQSINASFREGRFAARFLGGLVADRSYPGSGVKAVLEPVEPAVQRQAVRLIAREVLSVGAFQLPDEVRNSLAMDANSPESMDWTAPLRQIVGRQQTMVYAMAMSASTVDRISENHVKWGSKQGAYTLEEHLGTLLASVFEEVGGNKNIPATRRDLQRFAVSGLIAQVSAGQGAINEDQRMLASGALKRLSARFGDQIKHLVRLDGLTVAHLKDTKETIDRFLARHYAR